MPIKDFFNKPSSFDIYAFFTSLAALTRGGVDIVTALGKIRENEKNPQMKRVLEEIENDLAESSIDVVFDRQPIFDKVVPPSLKAGRASGDIAGVADQLGRATWLKSEIREK